MEGEDPIYFDIISSKVKVIVTINIFLTIGSFPHDNFSFVYLDLYQSWPRDSPVDGKEQPLFWSNYVKGQGHRFYEYIF